MVIQISKKQIAALVSSLVLLMAGMFMLGHAQLHSQAGVTTAKEKTVAVVDTLQSEVRLAVERQLVLEQVSNIFRLVKSDYMAFGGAAENELLDKAFCSKSWNELLMAVHHKESLTNTMFFEINYWSMTRNPGMIDFDEFEVTSLVLEPQKRATVTYTVYEMDTYNPAMIDLVYENGHWVIDNFHHMKYMLDLRSCMWNYIANDNLI